MLFWEIEYRKVHLDLAVSISQKMKIVISSWLSHEWAARRSWFRGVKIWQRSRWFQMRLQISCSKIFQITHMRDTGGNFLLWSVLFWLQILFRYGWRNVFFVVIFKKYQHMMVVMVDSARISNNIRIDCFLNTGVTSMHVGLVSKMTSWTAFAVRVTSRFWLRRTFWVSINTCKATHT